MCKRHDSLDPSRQPVPAVRDKTTQRRRFDSPLARFVFRSRIEPHSWEISRSVFLRGLGVIYAIAFLSFWTQLDGLIGRNGILPAADFTRRVITYASQNEPSAFWLAQNFWPRGGEAEAEKRKRRPMSDGPTGFPQSLGRSRSG